MRRKVRLSPVSESDKNKDEYGKEEPAKQDHRKYRFVFLDSSHLDETVQVGDWFVIGDSRLKVVDCNQQERTVTLQSERDGQPASIDSNKNAIFYMNMDRRKYYLEMLALYLYNLFFVENPHIGATRNKPQVSPWYDTRANRINVWKIDLPKEVETQIQRAITLEYEMDSNRQISSEVVESSDAESKAVENGEEIEAKSISERLIGTLYPPYAQKREQERKEAQLKQIQEARIKAMNLIYEFIAHTFLRLTCHEDVDSYYKKHEQQKEVQALTSTLAGIIEADIRNLQRAIENVLELDPNKLNNLMEDDHQSRNLVELERIPNLFVG